MIHRNPRRSRRERRTGVDGVGSANGRSLAYAVVTLCAFLGLAPDAAPAASPWRFTLKKSDFPSSTVGGVQTYQRRMRNRPCGSVNKVFLTGANRQTVVVGESVAYCRTTRAAQRVMTNDQAYAEQRNAAVCTPLELQHADDALDCIDSISEVHIVLVRRGARAARLMFERPGAGGLKRERQRQKVIHAQVRRLKR